MLFPALVVWGCMPELTKNYVDMTNASSTYPMVQYSVKQPRHMLVIKPTKFVSWDLGKIQT
jgi:hypothetical protein